MPGLQKVAAELAPEGLVLLTVASEGGPKAARRFAERVGISAPVLLGSEAVRRDFQIAAYPWTVIFDRQGKAVEAIRGYRAEDVLRATFAAHLAK